MTLRPFDVVVVPFPYSDRLSEKRRPGLVVSTDEMPENLARVWVAMITSASASQLADIRITDIEIAGLPVPSTARCSKIATLDVDRILRIAGHLSDRDEEAARNALRLCAAF